MKHTHLFRTMLAVVLATAFALSVGAFTPENVETAAEVETALSKTALADETTSDKYGKLLFHFSFNSGDKTNQVPDYIDDSIALTTGNNGGSLTVMSPAWWAMDGGNFVVNGYQKWPFGMQFKFTEPIKKTGRYTLEFASSGLSSVFGRFYDAPTNKDVSKYVSEASGKTVYTTYTHETGSRLSEITDVRVYGNEDGSIYCDYVKLWYLAPVEITFDYGIDTSLLVGDAPATRELYKGDPLPALTAKGYIHEGYVDRSGNPITIVPADPTTVKAVWTKGEVLFAFDFNSNGDAYSQQPSYIDDRISLTPYNGGKSALLWPSAEWISMENGAYKIGSSVKNYALRFTFAEPITTPGTYIFKIDSKNINAAFIDMMVDGQVKRSTYFQNLDKNSFTTLSFRYTLQSGESLTDVYAYANEGENTTALFDNATFIYAGVPAEPILSDKISIRTAEPQGLRVLSSVYNELLVNNETVEIGYLATTAAKLATYYDFLPGETVEENLTFGDGIAQFSDAYASGLAYRKADGTETINYLRDSGDGYTAVFTGAFVGVPESKAAYTQTIHLRPYVKIGTMYFYGNVKSLSMLDAAKLIKASEGYTTIDYVEKILTVCGEVEA